ncbi:two-component system, OmpR family, response regulator ResD [Thalassobacillus cyri]|uniref:Two-component system, OmpR family, response regulator ResD n=1 Tax=Thalassobacillus cyri TaxID=571932 RepID=A0A1H4G994_9BACI|nr:response regulator transcription factor [Thalassobacillus cyri]SEB05590.1 two-component system, OmpR family, response regulator ResD [Thalassobacillus cyri]
MNDKILVVDDEWNMRNLIKIYLSKEKFHVDEARDGNEAVSMVQQNTYDLLILDIMMPGMDGWEVCSELRKISQIPILMLTARNEINDRVHGLNLGADDYLIKPFAPEELVARVKALLRRHIGKEKADETTLLLKDLTIDYESRVVICRGVPVEMTPKEFEIIHSLASQPKRVFTREMLLDTIWGMNEYRDLRAIDTHVKNIREKLGKTGLSYIPIKTVWGVGYKFNTPGDQPQHE